MPKSLPTWKKSMNQEHLENSTYEQIVSHLERELELNDLEAPIEMQIISVTQQASQQNTEKFKPTSHHCEKPGHYRNQCPQLKREKVQARKTANSADKTNNNNGSAQTSSNSNSRVSNNTNANNTNNQRDRRSILVFPPCDTCGRTNHFTEKSYLGADAAIRPPPRNRRQKTKPSPTEKCSKQPRGWMSELQSKL